MAPFQTARAKLEALRRQAGAPPRRPLLWVVGYVNGTLDDNIADTLAAQNGGADGFVFETQDFGKLDSTLEALRGRFPNYPMGVNCLGPKEKLHTFRETFELAGRHRLQIAWTDFSGVDLIREAPEVSLHDIEAARARAEAASPGLFYCSGIHMKYSTLVDAEKPIEQSALQALGWVDGVIVTGPKTGVPADAEKLQRVRSVIGSAPLGVASGLSAENAGMVLPHIDFALVNSSVADSGHRVLEAKVRALVQALQR